MTEEFDSLTDHPAVTEWREWGDGEQGVARKSIVEFAVDGEHARAIIRRAFDDRDDVTATPVSPTDAEIEVAVNTNEKYVPEGETIFRIEEEDATAVTVNRLRAKHGRTTDPAGRFTSSASD